MFKELVDRLVELGERNASGRVIATPAEPSHTYCLQKPDGSLEYVRATPPKRSHYASDVATLAAIVKRFAEQGKHIVSVWYSQQGVLALLDDDDRHDRAILPLSLSSFVVALRKLEHTRTWLTQVEFIQLLRITLAGCLSSSNILSSVRSVKFRQLAQGERDVQHGKVSLGKSLEAELNGASTIPEEMSLWVPIFPGVVDAAIMIPVALDVDPVAEKFLLQPLPGSVDAAIREAEKRLGALVRAALEGVENVAIHYGCP